MPADANSPGDIFGGYIMSLIEMAGGAAEFKFSSGRIVTDGVKKMAVLVPIPVGDPMSCYIQIVSTGRSSIVTRIEPWIRRREGSHQIKCQRGRVQIRQSWQRQTVGTGWKHYANKWDVVTPSGTIHGTCVLLHLRKIEQPFTRSLSDNRIPRGIISVMGLVYDKIHGYGGKVVTVKVPANGQGS